MRHQEDDLQKACVRWFDYRWNHCRLLLHHSPNEGELIGGPRAGAKRKAMGVRAGFPDLVLLRPSGGCPFLCVELKTRTGRQSATQREYQRQVEAVGGRYVVVRSVDEFISVMETYMAGEVKSEKE